FTTLRGFAVEDGRLSRFAEEIDRYVDRFDLGEVLWPAYPVLFAANLGDLADEIARRGLYLFDIWGYVPGSGPGGYWQQYHPPAGVFELLESRLGERWLGMDVGEQDGRYIGGYASQMHPVSGDRVEQYLNFQRHFQRLCDDLGNRMATLVSLNFGHHLVKEGVYTTIGAETAQGLPNGQVYYAFIRGAGKQYGVPWFGNASVWNRWGWKTYEGEGADHGPEKGTSLSLLRRLLYTHVLYNCAFVGFESSWLEGDDLSPVGRIQRAAHQWVRRHPDPGVQHTPVALLVDFYSGWSFPRHLYTGRVYRVWGNLPYGPGDYLTDAVLDLFYPGYQDASFYRDERGFVTPTPYGDGCDCLLTDAAGWLLARYPVLVLAGALEPTLELRHQLEAYLGQGGHLVLTAANLAAFAGGVAGVQVEGPAASVAAGATVQLTLADDAGAAPRGDRTVTEDHSFELYPLSVDEQTDAASPGVARVLARCGDAPAAVEVRRGRGTLTVLASPFALPAQPTCALDYPDPIDHPLPRPYPLLRHAAAVLDAVFRVEVLFEVGEGLSLVTCRRGPGQYTLGLANNGLSERPYQVVSRCGELQSVEELTLDGSERGARGYLPTGLDGTDVGATRSTGAPGPLTAASGTLAGGDLRIFRVAVREGEVTEIPHLAPPPRPRGRGLPLRGLRSIQEHVLRRPTFFQHFDAVVVDWRYVEARDRAQLAREAGWLGRQGLRVYVDLTSGINLYPDLRLVDNDAAEYGASLARVHAVLDKMPALGARDLILSLHRVPENNISAEDTWASFERTLRDLAARAAGGEVQLYLRPSLKDRRPVADLADLVARVGAASLRLAPATALLLDAKAEPEAVAAALGHTLGLWLVSAPAYDAAGALWSASAAAASAPADRLARLLRAGPGVPRLLDGVYSSWDEEYLDARVLASGAPAA
ncbi:MAG: hypothetical protein ABIL09_14420, partial [Gemmatimonadota bacterium]